LRKISQSPRFCPGTDRERGTQQTPGSDERPPSPLDKPGKAPPGPSLASAGAYAGLGFQFVLSILLFLYAGQWLDRKLGTTPLFLIVGTFAGAAAGFYAIYRKLMADQKREEQQRSPRP
jgi:hypothetical protein